ncbi:unnamed protein product [Adineta ricciae]|uniref:OTU domain-containing protein n=1 Tax=Adineta ricciae TaxID=249248 RepID=A0A815T961_ADIRI|nr:unnamed protein product [Adineta ricciae]
MCNLRSNFILCDVCSSESREDFYLLLLTRLKDECDDYFGFEAKCIDMQDVIDHYTVPDDPVIIFDQNVHQIDNNSKQLLENYTGISVDEAVPIMVAGDGDCLFHSLRTLYPTMSIDELRARAIVELCSNKYYYETVKSEMNLELVDDESVQSHVLRIANSQEYSGVLTIAALSTVTGRAIESIYPSVNENDRYYELLNNVFIPRNKPSSLSTMPLRIMWTGPKQGSDRMWVPNHFVPLLSVRQSNSSIETIPTIVGMDNDEDMHVEYAKASSRIVSRTNNSKTNHTSQIEDEKENNSEIRNDISIFDKRQIFLEAPAIIQRMIQAVKEDEIFELPPKIVTHSSMFNVKLTKENRLSIGKDGNGIWTKMRSVKTMFIFKEPDKYQIVRQDDKGTLFYNERVGNHYIACPVNPNQVITMHRYYATNATNSSFRRMIAYIDQMSVGDDSNKLNLPIFLQYVTGNQYSTENLRLKPHGNATKFDRSFTSTLPSVLGQIQAQPRFLKPSTIYNASIRNVEEASLPAITTVRDRKQVYNARQKNESSVEEYMSIMRRLEDTKSTVARISMSRGEAPVLLLSQSHMIKELKRCCLNSSEHIQSSVLCIDTTFNLGRFFVTPIAYRNIAVQYRKTKKAPIFIGPIMIHYRDDTQSYQELLTYVHQELKNCDTVVIGSDGAKAIKKAVENVFPHSTHLYCTRHVRQNIERQLMKYRTTLEERRGVLERIFDSSESLIQSETEEEFQDRLSELSEYWRTIQNSGETRSNGVTDFFQWFNQYQVNIFRNHLIAAIRIPINFLDRNGSPRLFYNNDIESMNYAFKNQTNWEQRSLSEIIDILSNLITAQKNESIRALYDSGELELVPPFSRFVCDSHIWSAKTLTERNQTIEDYYNYVPPDSKPKRNLNISQKAGRKPGRSKVRGSSTTTRKKK